MVGYQRFGAPCCFHPPKRWLHTATLHGVTTLKTSNLHQRENLKSRCIELVLIFCRNSKLIFQELETTISVSSFLMMSPLNAIIIIIIIIIMIYEDRTSTPF
jgi:hypothetical protein